MNTVLQQAVKYLFDDQGLEVPPGFVLPKTFSASEEDIAWGRVTVFLQGLSSEDLETFCVGDQDDALTLAMEGGENGNYALRALDALFFEILGGGE